MQDFISIKADINGSIPPVTVKQFDNNSRFLHVTLTDSDLSGECHRVFQMTDCTARLLISLGQDRFEYVEGEIDDAEDGVVTFLLPGSVTQTDGEYECEICIFGDNNQTRPVISTKPFTLKVEQSIRNDSAILATPGLSTLDEMIFDVRELSDQMKLYGVTPEMFGAVGDGQNDDYRAIQDCVDYAFRHGTSVEFGNKTYAVSNTVRLYANCIYNGNNCTIRQTANKPVMATYKYFDATRSGYHITINDFFLEGNISHAENDGLILCGWYIRVNNVNVQNVGGHGIVVTSFDVDGNEVSATTLVEGMIRNTRVKSGVNKYPFYQRCDHVTITDWRVENCIFSSDYCECFMKFNRIAGWFLSDVQCYGLSTNAGLYADFGTSTQLTNIVLDGITRYGMCFRSQLGPVHLANIRMIVHQEMPDAYNQPTVYQTPPTIYAIRQEGGSGIPRVLDAVNVSVTIPDNVTPSGVFLHDGWRYIFNMVNPSFIQHNSELDYLLFARKTNEDIFRLNGLEMDDATHVNVPFDTLARRYHLSRYSTGSETLTLTISPVRPVKCSGLLVIIGEVNGAQRGNSVYSIGLFRRGTAQPCQLLSQQSGYEFTNVRVVYDAQKNAYTISATTPDTGNCTYSMNVIF